MRTCFFMLLTVLLGSCTLIAQEVEQANKRTLKVGDVPPPLQATRWLGGPEVQAFEPGKIYIVEFWATWCGPCIAMMPHLGDLQDHLGSTGTIIGFTAVDPGNSVEQITKFVEKRRSKLGYAIAYSENRDTYDAFMKGSGQSGIPCSFVIGKDGKLAFIGHPLFLESVIPKVLDGTWDPSRDAEELAAADKLWDKTYATMNKPGDPMVQLAEWEEFNAKWPTLANDPYMNAARLKLLIAAKRLSEAEKLADSMLSKALERNDTFGLRSVCNALGLERSNIQPELVSLGTRAANVGIEIEGETSASFIRAANAHAAAGDMAKSKEYGRKAVDAAQNELTNETDPKGILGIAAAHFAAGNLQTAKEYAEKAISKVDEKNAGMKRYIAEQAKKFGAESNVSQELDEKQ
ncbi:MAG: TlpA family protein disulfide reductase [Pirellulaceae bacterium]|nr:TlpA family protein disulfide reductase [Pirellulaceae bacterium]